jgi:hypothetical protein
MGKALQIGFGQPGQVDEVIIADAAHAVARAENLRAGIAFAHSGNGAGDGGVDDGGRAAALGDDENLAQWTGPPMRRP